MSSEASWLERLRFLLYAPPSEAAWEALCAQLAEAPAGLHILQEYKH